MSAPDHFIADDGLRIPLRVTGKGPALVMIHGWTARQQDWLPLVERFKDRYTCHVWEARPHQPDAPDPTIERMARDLHNLLDALQLDRPMLIGHSMGALTTWEYLRQFGDGRLSSLCLIDQSPRLLTGPDWDRGLYGHYTERHDAEFVANLRINLADEVAALIRRSRHAADSPLAEMMIESRRQFLSTVAPEPWITAWRSLVVKDYRDVLPSIGVPTFLAYGGSGTFYGQRVADYVHANIRNSEMKMYQSAAHSPHLESLPDFTRDFLDFAGRFHSSSTGTA